MMRKKIYLRSKQAGEALVKEQWQQDDLRRELRLVVPINQYTSVEFVILTNQKLWLVVPINQSINQLTYTLWSSPISKYGSSTNQPINQYNQGKLCDSHQWATKTGSANQPINVDFVIHTDEPLKLVGW